jgi:predicted permease
MKRILRYLRQRRFDRDLEAELQAHLDERVDDLIDDGLSPEQARAAASRRFGNRTLLAERSREVWVFASLDAIWEDLRFAARMLRKNPGFTGVALLSLALGIGTNTIIFSAVDNVLLRALPYSAPDRLLTIWGRATSHGVERGEASAADFYDWRAQSQAFQAIAAYASWPMNLTDVAEPLRLESQLVSANFFSTLGATAELGRTFAPDDDQERTESVVVISHHLWRVLGESTQILGRRLTINGSPATVIGVMPNSFSFPSSEVDVWVPLSLSAANRANREGRWLKVVGRLKAGVGIREAASEMDVIAKRLAATYPLADAGWSTSLIPLKEELVGKAQPILLALQAGGLILLLITCANLANLLLARGVARGKEIAVRVALGAGRARILRQLMVESMLLAALGGSLGIALSLEGIAAVRDLGENFLPRARDIGMSGTVLGFALAITALTALSFGIAPALHSSRIHLLSQVKSAGRNTPRNLERKRSLLVAIEIGLASVLLVGALLLGESLHRVVSTAPGFRADHVLTMRMTLSRSKYPTNTSQIAFFQQVLEGLRRLPGVISAGEVSDTPLKSNNPTFEFTIQGMARDSAEGPIQAGLRVISTGYFKALGIPLLGGRGFTGEDRTGGRLVAIVNDPMARRYWPGVDPIGQTIRLREDRRWITIIGVAAEIKHMGLTSEEGPVVYIPYAQKTQDWLVWTTLMVRTTGEPQDSVRAVRNTILTIDKNQPVSEIATLDQILTGSTAIPRFTTLVIAALSAFALLIALVGVYGLLAYTVTQRVPELGIRLTLGASPRQIVSLLVCHALVRILLGISGGLLGAWWLVRWIDSMLFGVRAHDPATFAAVAGLLIVASLVAVSFSARRAMRIDPSIALRAE